MKLKRYIAIFMAVLILAVSLPLNSLIMKPSAESASEQDKINAIKTAWALMEEKILEINPGSGKSNSVTAQYFSSANTSVLPAAALPVPDTLGASFAKATLGATATAPNPLNNYGSDYLKYSQSNVNIENTNLYFNFFVEQLNGSLSFTPFFRESSATGFDTGKTYTVKSGDVGKWVTLSLNELGGAYYDQVSNLNNHLILGINSTANNTAYLGSFIFTKKVSLPTGSDGWTLKQWLNMGNALDLSKYMNTEKLKEALRAADPESTLLEDLKTAWKGLEEKVLEIVPNSKGGTVTAYTSKKAEGTPEMVGSYLAEITTGASTVQKPENLSTSGNYIKYGNNVTVDISKLNPYFSFYVDELSGNLSFISYFRKSGTGGLNTGFEYSVKTSDIGKWVTLKPTELKGPNYNLMTNIGNNIILGINSSKVNKIKIGSYIFTKNIALPENTGDWTYVDWVNAANSLDISKYINTEPFKEALKAANEGNAEVRVTKKLRDAWRNMTEKFAELSWVGASGIKETDFYFNAGKTDALPSNAKELPENVKIGYAAATFTNTGAYAANAYGTSYLKSGGSTANFSGSKIFLNFYIEPGQYKEGLSFYISYRSSGSTGFNTGNLYTVKPEDVGKWVTLDSDDLTATGAITAPNLGNSAILSVYGAKETGSKIYFATPYFTQNVTMPQDSGLWDLPQLVAEARNLNLDNYFNTSDFLEALIQAENYLKQNGIPVAKMNKVPDDISALGENKLSGITPEITYYNGSQTGAVSNADVLCMADGDLTTAVKFNGINVGEGKYLDVTYKLGGYVDIEKLLISGLSTDEMGAYEIYFGDEKDTLYDSGNCLVNANSEITEGSGQVIELYSKIKVTYVGFRFTQQPGSLNIAELGIYGEKTAYTFEKGNFGSEKISSFGYNLLLNRNVSPKFKVNGNRTNVSGYDYRNLTDKDSTTGYAVGVAQWNDGENDKKYCDIYYDLGASYKIDKLFINHWAESYLESGLYEIHIAKTSGELFLSSSSVLRYDNSSDSENGTSVSQVFTFAEGEEPIGRFVSFRIRCSVSDYEKANKAYPGLLYVRLTEFGVFGEEYTPPAKPTNLLSHVPVDIYRTKDGNHTLIGENELTSTEIKELYDGNYSQEVNINTEGKNLDFIFNLCGSMKLDEFNVFAKQKQITRLKVYAAETAEELWEEQTLAYDSGNITATNELKKALSTQVSARFLRYSVTVNSSVFSVTEFEAIGMDDQALTYRNLMLENDSAVSLYSMDYKTGYLRKIQETEHKTYARPQMQKAYMTDGDKTTVFDIYSAEYGKSSIDIVVDLGSLHSVDSIIMKAGSDSNHWPENMNIYASESENKVIDAAAEPAYTFTKKATDGVYAYESTPKYARYIRFQITKSIHPYINSYMLAVISELEINGLAVSGRIAEDVGAVLSFTDEATNIKVNIMQQNDNDVYAGVSSIKVTPANVKLSEKESLQPYSMMIHGKKYDIKLLDRKGNVVNDIGGRNVTVFVPVPEGIAPTEAYVASFGGGEAQILNTDVYENRVAAIFNDTTSLSVGVASFVVEYPDDYFVPDKEEDNSSKLPQKDEGKKEETEDDNTDVSDDIPIIENTDDYTEETTGEITLTDETTGVKVVYSEGELPEDAELSVKIVGSESIPKVLAEKLPQDKYVAYRIEFTSGGEAVEPSGMVKIVIPVPQDMTAENCKIYFFADGKSNITDMNAVLENGELSFYNDKNGVYMVTDTDLSKLGGKQTVVKKKNNNSDFPYGLLIGGGAALLLITAGIIFFIIFAKKRKKKN